MHIEEERKAKWKLKKRIEALAYTQKASKILYVSILLVLLVHILFYFDSNHINNNKKVA